MNVQDMYPLTSVQEGMLFHSLQETAAAPYVEQVVLNYGRLDVDRLERAWRRVVERHPILRTAFFWEEIEAPVQVVHRTVELPFAREDWRDLPATERQERLDELLAEDRQRGFALDRAPLLRITSIHWDDQTLRLLWTYHHILLDGWSIAPLFEDITLAYQVDGGPFTPPPRRPFREYVSWLRKQDLAAAEAYWRGKLAGVAPAAVLGIDRAPGRPVSDDEHVEIAHAVSAPTTAAIEELARRHRLTLYTLVEGAWALALARLSGERDLVFGSIVSGRPTSLPGAEAMLGCFINTLPVRVRVAPERQVISWLRELQADQMELRRFEHSSLVDVRRWSGLPHGSSLFDHLLVFENYASRKDDERPTVVARTNYPFTLVVWPRRELTLTARFYTGRFATEAVAPLLAFVAELLEALTAIDENTRTDELPLLPAADFAQITRINASARIEIPVDRCVHELIAEQAARTPTAPAASFLGLSLTYAQLAARSNTLARHLRRLGVGPGVLVGIAMERSLDLPVAVLGVLQSGGAYVPLDPGYPAERLDFMLRDSRVPVLLTQSRLAASLPAHGFVIVPLDAGPAFWDVGEDAAAPAPLVGPEDLAYVLYTSGSSGKPKAVQVPHRALTNVLLSVLRAPGLEAGDLLLAVTSLSFDIAAVEIFLPLLAGARLEIVPAAVAADGERLVERIIASGATVLQATPATWRMLLEAGWPEEGGLRLALTAGEALAGDLAAALQRRARQVWNAYGPTETTVFSTALHVTDTPPESVVAIGRPIANTRVHVLDRWGDPLPSGVPGELALGGVGVTRGYLGRPELTAEKFVPDRWGGAGERLYLTGDLVRLHDDVLGFLGRLDHQVKLRGFRIEPGEIEASLRLLPGVSDAVVTARHDGDDSRLIAYVVPPAGAGTPDASELRRLLRRSLPEHMVPSLFVPLAELPLTPNRKVDRKALPAPELGAARTAVHTPPRDATEEALATIWTELLNIERIGVEESFFALGGDSIKAVRLVGRVNARLAAGLRVQEVFEHPTIATLAARLRAGKEGMSDGQGQASPPDAGSEELRRHSEQQAQRTEQGRSRRELSRRKRDGAAGAHGGSPSGDSTGTEIAILALEGRFPRAADLADFWRNLRDGVEAVSSFSAEELIAAGESAVAVTSPSYVRAGAILEDADLFDAELFDILPSEAELIDPQQRLLLECAHQALEQAGYAGTRRPVGVFAGTGENYYALAHLLSRPQLVSSVGRFALSLASSRDYVATRLSYKLDLTGPSVNVQTACSTSLVAVHLACQSLLAGECDLALAGGASVHVPFKSGYTYQPGGIVSSDGHCRAFDARAQGTVPGQGVGVVVLKLLANALADRDPIRAVIRGSAINNDGLLKTGFTAPRRDGQAQVIRAAHLQAQVDPDSIGYVEAHGTATPLGDPIEVAALTRAFAQGSSRRGFCALGSVKTNIGHLDAAAGVAGLIKTVLALEHAEIPPSLHFATPNPEIDFANSPFYVAAQLTPWPALAGAPRRAGVSSFGLGGTNAHVVLEEAPAASPSGPARPWQLLLLSARTATALERATDDLAADLAAYPEPGSDDPARCCHLADTAFTLQVGRRAYRHRRALVVASTGEAAAALFGRDPRRLATGVEEPGHHPIAFLLPGVGDQYAGMAYGLYVSEPVFRRELDRCAAVLDPLLGVDLSAVLFAGEKTRAGRPTQANGDLIALLRRGGDARETSAGPLHSTRMAQPAMLALGWSLAQLWMSWGIAPQALLGYSLGEYTAACLAGVLSLADALTLAARRAELIEKLPRGTMLAVPLPEVEAAVRLTPGLSIAAVNAPSVCVVAGPDDAVAALEGRLATEGLPCRRLRTTHAFHSCEMAPIAESLRALVRAIPLAPPQIPYLSNVTGTWIRTEEATDPEYWVRHLLGTVRFADAVAELWREPGRILLEMGPGQALASLALQQADERAGGLALAALPHELDRRPDPQVILGALGQLWLAGVDFDWEGFHAAEERRRVPLPTYPFERRRFWIDPPSAGTLAVVGDAVRLPDMADWFHAPSWKRSPPPRTVRTPVAGSWLVLTDRLGLGARLVERLRAAGCNVHSVDPGDYAALQSAADSSPAQIVHLWTLGVEEGVRELGFGALLTLAQSLRRNAETTGEPGRLRLSIVTDGLCGVERRDRLQPDKATLLGPLRVIPQEYPHVDCRAVDVDSGDLEGGLADRLLGELAGGTEPLVAWRGARRWVQSFEPVRLTADDGDPGPLRAGGVYLITGGFGGIGFALADTLARTLRARLVLLGRSPLPDRTEWTRHLAADDETARRIRAVQALEAAGAEVLPLSADVSDEGQMRAAVARLRERFGALHGVFHAAGVPGAGLIQLKSRAEAAAVLAPKADGARVLATVLREAPPELVVLFSSITTLTGGLGQVDYCAANACLDAMAEASEEEGATGFPIIAVDWCEWQWDAWTGTTIQDPELRAAMARHRQAFGLSFAEGIEALRRILASGLRRVVVSTRNLERVLAERHSLPAVLGGLARRTAALQAGRASRPRPELPTRFVAPQSVEQESLAALWRELLGIAEVGIHDDFFQLGGHSLLGLQLLSHIRSASGIELPLRSLFEAPTIADLAAAILELSTGGEAQAAPPLARRSRPPLLPLSFAQQRLWFLAQLEPESAAYNVPLAIRARGRLDLSALRRSLAELVRRHESLRTSFAVHDRQPAQVIAAAADLRVPLVDLAALPAGRRDAAQSALAAREALYPFDLATAPLLRATVVHLASEEHVLLLTMHHISSDDWSVAVLSSDLIALYGAFSRGEPSPLAELPIQYADYVQWQHDRLQGEILAAQLRYWTGVLTGVPVLQLPTDRPRPSVQTYRGAFLPIAVPASIAGRVADLGRSCGATPYMAFLTAFFALLHRYSGQDGVIVGSTVSGRDRRELEPIVGLFVNTLALRLDLAGDPTFSDLLTRVRQRVLGAFAHQELPFEKLVAELQPERDLSRSPLFQVVFQLLNASLPQGDLPGLTFKPAGVPGQTAKFDLILNLQEAGGGLLGGWRYNRDLFDAATASRMAGHFATLLDGIAAAGIAERRLSELPLLTAAEERQLADEWTGGEAPAAMERFCLHARVAAHAARTPEAVAVACDGETLTYAELHDRAGRLARALHALGVAPGQRVGICLDRSVDLVAALLGVLRAGAAYVPIDPDYPAERIAFLTADSGVPVLLTQSSLADRLPGAAAPRLLLDGPEGWPDGPVTAPRTALPEIDPGWPAYVIYTSGSTGKPKGVVVSHAHVARLFTATAPWFGFGPDDVWTLFHSSAFDFSVWEVWGALLHGGRLVVVPYWVSRSPEAFRELLASEQVTVLNQTPSAFRPLIRADEVAGGRGDLALRTVIFGGEALELASLAPWFDRHGDRCPRLVNMYGITETTVHVTYRPLCRADLAAPGSTIGRPISDLALRVLDRGMQPSPIGVPGEIFVGGAGPALGYLDRPELTAERFVPDPFSTEPGARLYHSGDLVRRLSDGDLQYLGRADHQIKVRGFRIELGEIETELARHPAVLEAVVTARAEAGGAGGAQLIAYVVTPQPPPQEPSLGELRSFLAASLPDYMLPTALVVIERLPLTAHGKVDRAALPAPDHTRPHRQDGEEPETELERFLAGLWRDTLGLPAEHGIGRDEDFFALGGNSITGAILINRLQEEIGEIVQVVVIFDAPTVSRMAEHLVREHSAAVARRWPAALGGASPQGPALVRPIAEDDLQLFQSLVRPLPPSTRPTARTKNPPAVFVLSPPRSGSTLLRVMLGGHPRLFAPPELELLSFDTLAERRAAFSGRDSFWLEGALRAVMEIRGCGADEAAALIAEMETQDHTTAELYGALQEWLGPRMLVDKTPSYALNPAVLARAEEVFDQPLYIHLIRHPLGMIRSFEEAKLDQLFFRRDHPFTRRQLAELIWTASERNIEGFLAGIDATRQHAVCFEELLREPARTLRGLCAFLGLDYDPAMAEPYQGGSGRMTDGPHAESRMLGDVKFLRHQGIDPGVAEHWREVLSEASLGEVTRATAERLGYSLADSALVRIEPLHWPSGEPIPLSFAQERLWFLDRLAPGSAAYNVPIALRFAGRLDPAALARGLAEIVRRHAILRTHFVSLGGEPGQVVTPAADLPFPCVDLGGLPPEMRQNEALRLAAREAVRPFDLARGPLLRATLLRLGPTENVPLLTLHHIVADGWSMGILVREMAALYGAFAQGLSSPLPDLDIQYADYAVWQRLRLRSEVLAREIAFWRQALAGAPALELPTDRPRPPVQTTRGAQRPFHLPNAVASPLAALGLAEGASLFMTLLVGFAAVLSRYTGQEDLTIGSPVANRTRAQVEGLIGFFVNTLVLRVDLSGNPSLRTLLGRARQTALAAFAHQELPFEKVVEELQPQRDLSRTPLFQVMLSLQNASEEKLELPGLILEPLGASPPLAKFDLTLMLNPSPDGLAGALEHNVDLFDAPTAGRMVGHLTNLLAAAVAAPDSPLAALPLLGEAEREQVLRQWNDTAAEPAAACLHQLFEAQAERTPDAVAAVHRELRLTYRELDERACGLAQRLRALGVGPEVRVGVCLERSLELLTALLAVLKAGGAYVPLDPSYPRKRIAFMLADSGAKVLLTKQALAGRLEEVPARILVLDREVDVAAPETAPAARHAPVAPGHLAYVIYTSGSTGRPKGVAIEHASAAVMVCWAREVFAPRELAGVLAATSICFDLSVFEIFVPLTCGGAVILAAHALELPTLPAAGEVTLVNTVPSVISELTRAGKIPPSVCTVNLAGEPLQGALARAIFSHSRAERVLNLYGPSEDTTYSTWAAVAAESEREPAIGRPIAGTRALVLDRVLRPVPVGVPGELCLAGNGLARGYLGRPELTAERFVPDPYAAAPGERLYRTGDLARHLPHGALDYLGRLDLQVKVRGFRVELGEIEAALTRHPDVAQAAAMVRESPEGDRWIVAYVVPLPPALLNPAELRDWLLSRLPEYMVPAAWVVLSGLPLTPNGKVDRKALPAPEPAVVQRAPYTAPSSGFERLIADLWQELLGIDAVGVEDNFFDLGGHSLLLARVQSRLSEAFGREIDMVDLFSHPTVLSLACFLTGDLSGEQLRRRSERHSQRAEQGRSRLEQRRRERRQVGVFKGVADE